ncbi:MAG: 30S ribosomal protein S4e [Candidatus ainarchaeum sp.]|nr:30S ribosomal protein S4e [Candidatus ainarchaeum sp.]
MSKKGQNKKLKALNAPKIVQIKRKENVWTIKTRAGTHKAQNSIPLGILLRDYIKIVGNLKEAKNILLNGEVKIDGKIRKDYRFGIGLFDAIIIKKQKLFYRMILDKKGRLKTKEMKEEPKDKICKVEHKKAFGKKIQITTNDGRTFINKEANIGDSVKINLHDGKIEKILKQKQNATIYITSGSHCSETGKIKEIIPSSIKREKLVKIEQDGKIFETIIKNIIIIGDEKEEIQL